MKNNIFSSKLKNFRQKKGLSQQQIALSLFVSPQAVSTWERGISYPDISLLKPLSELLGVSLDELLSVEKREGCYEGVVFYSSIRGFAKKASEIDPREYASILNGIHLSLTELLSSFQGVPIKYLGDGFLAYFVGQTCEDRAVEISKKALNALEAFPLLISLHKGPFYISKIGHPDYSKLDIVGKTVNECVMMNHWANHNTKSKLTVSNEVFNILSNTSSFETHSASISDSELTMFALA